MEEVDYQYCQRYSKEGQAPVSVWELGTGDRDWGQTPVWTPFHLTKEGQTPFDEMDNFSFLRIYGALIKNLPKFRQIKCLAKLTVL